MMKILSRLLLIISCWLLVAPVAFAQSAWTRGIWWNTGRARPRETCNYLPAGCNLCDGIKVAQNIIQMLFELAIPITVAMIIWGGFLILTAGGSEERFGKGKKTITAALTGLVIVLLSWSIINVLLHVLTGQLDFPWARVTC